MTNYDPSELVPHPRYGSEVRRSEQQFDAATVRSSFWRYSSERIFPESAIKADVDKQNYSMYPRPYYVDVLMTCEDCSRDFLFFAEEQRHWHEELGFYVDAWCVHCCECRKAQQATKFALQDYSNHINNDQATDAELEKLVNAAVLLWNQNVIRKEQHLRRVLKRATRQIPDSEATTALRTLVESMPEGASKPEA